MSASLDTVAAHLERIERVLAERSAQSTRSLSVDSVVALTGIPRRAILSAPRRPGRLAGAPRRPVLTRPPRKSARWRAQPASGVRQEVDMPSRREDAPMTGPAAPADGARPPVPTPGGGDIQ